MTGTAKTKLFILITLGVIILFDIVAICTWGVDATISRIVLAWAQAFPLLPLGVGILIGHLFWPQKITVKPIQPAP